MKSHGLLHKSERIHILRSSYAEKGRKKKQKKLFADPLVPIEMDWSYQYLSSINNEFLTECWEGCAEQW